MTEKYDLPGRIKKYTNEDITEYIENKNKTHKLVKYMRQLELEKKHIESELDSLDSYQYDYVDFTRYDCFPSERMASCMNFWESDVYHENKVVHLQKTYRCKNKFCVNCKTADVGINLAKISPILDELSEKYIPFLITLTIPNVLSEEYRVTVGMLNKKFQLFYRLFSYKIDSKNSYKDRKYSIVGALRSLETTVNIKANTYHPHLHILAFIETDNLKQFKKYIKGEYDYKKQKYNMLSDADQELRQLWTRIYNGIDRRQNDIGIEPYLCDIRPIEKENEDDVDGILEVLKYSFKTRHIENYEIFKTLYYGTYRRRLKQGYGLLYNLNFEDEKEESDIKLSLFDEIPEHEKIHLKSLVQKYGDYTKLTNFQSYKDIIEYIKPMLDD